MSTTESHSKADQLARIRRNQQRCRERKRAYLVELENQVEVLASRLRACEPCAGLSPRRQSASDATLRENAARHRLLLTLGIDDQTQQHFIDTYAPNENGAHTAFWRLADEQEVSVPAQNSSERVSQGPTASSNDHTVGEVSDTTFAEFPIDQFVDHLNTQSESTNLSISQEAAASDTNVEPNYCARLSQDEVANGYTDRGLAATSGIA
ncbi:hypothetical protein K461DRAFT_174457 [Myriangium duriaei CBS 260.36]|uniref:BZIP domain-containing protein n=1 Tax=Myriangium duriaei CBS 260.36 TaxID=1168546 RepID=A0A9P4IX47_9PEZI|nr:hypothetical protein K461DRAFT_174457 [Myriangium duriaei CBS 260.36]